MDWIDSSCLNDDTFDWWSWVLRAQGLAGVRHRRGKPPHEGWEIIYGGGARRWTGAPNVTSLKEGKKLVEVLNRMGG